MFGTLIALPIDDTKEVGKAKRQVTMVRITPAASSRRRGLDYHSRTGTASIGWTFVDQLCGPGTEEEGIRLRRHFFHGHVADERSQFFRGRRGYFYEALAKGKMRREKKSNFLS